MKDTANMIDSARPLKMRWVMIGLAFLATTLNYIHRSSFNFLAASKGEDGLGKLIPDDVFGYLGAAFFVAYTISNAFSGFVIDKLKTRVGYAVCMAFWTTAGLLHAFAITPLQFGICRFLLGIGEAGNWPAAIRLTAEWFPQNERSTASGIFNSGAALGLIVVSPLVAMLSASYGWQSTFIILAAFGYLWLVAYWFIYYTPGNQSEVKTKALPARKLLKTRFVRTFALSKVFLDPVFYFVTFWMAKYMADVHHWDLKTMGWYATIPFIIADVGNIVGGYMTQFIIKCGMPIPRARKLSVAISGVLMGMPLLLAPWIVTTPMSALIIFGISGFGFTSYNANSLAFPADVVPKTSAASVWGLACIGAGIGGVVFQAVSGKVVATISASIDFLTAYNFIFVGYGIIAFIGVLIVLFVMPPLHKDEALHAYALQNETVNEK
jgi:ACS family hexuronate transporter-like MFS transporter